MGESSNTRNVLKLVRDLQRRKARDARPLVIAEGRRIVADVMLSGMPVVALLAAEDAADGAVAPLLSAAVSRGIETEIVGRSAFDAVADTETPSGVLAVVEWRPSALEDLRALERGTVRVLIIDGVQDPGNVGTMIRAAHTLGAAFTIALDGSADVRSPKVVRAAMGSLFRHPVAQATWRELKDFWNAGGPAVFLAVQDGESIATLDPPAPEYVALVVGSEGRGVRASWATDWMWPQRRVTIPMREGAESLNAAVAAGILLFELLRVGR